MKLAEILTGPETWCQGGYRTPKGDRMCLVGGVIELLNSHEDEVDRGAHPEYQRLRRAIELVEGDHIGSVSIWNDRPWRSWDDVAAVVDAYDRDRMLNP